MITLLSPPLTPRDGQILRVIGICRISTVNQDIRSLADQKAYYIEYLKNHYDGEYTLETIESQGSGERLNRPELDTLRKRVRSRQYDLVITEDQSRILRDIFSIGICRICRDHGTRLIAINDRMDTADPGWMNAAFLTAYIHQKCNEDTANRIKRTFTNRFQQGSLLKAFIYGYIVPPNATHMSQVQKDPEAIHVYEHWFAMLEQGYSYAAVADWLNSKGIPLPTTVISATRWTPALVKYHTFNPLLKGIRERNRKISVKCEETGEHHAVNAPPEKLLTYACPHLAFINPDRYDRVISMLKYRNKNYGRKHVHGKDPLLFRPKKRTAFPGQQCICGICGRPLVFGAHGLGTHLFCRGGAEYQCWNTISFDKSIAQRRIAEAVLQLYRQLPLSGQDFYERVKQQDQLLDQERVRRENLLRSRQVEYDKKFANWESYLLGNGDDEGVRKIKKNLDQIAAELKNEAFALQLLKDQAPQIPSADELLEMAKQTFGDGVDLDSQEFAMAMRRVITRFIVHPYRIYDGGHPILRAHLTLNLLGLANIPVMKGISEDVLTPQLVIDLFEYPQRIKYRQQVVQLLARGLNQDTVAQQTGITKTAVQQTIALHRDMIRQGLSDPYVLLREPPSDYAKLKSHRNHRYHFEPLEGYPIVLPSALAPSPQVA